MTSYTFDQQIALLGRTFGERLYGEDRRKIIWVYVHKMSDEWMERTVRKFVSSLRQAPLPMDFIEEAQRERRATTTDFDLGNVQPREDSIFSKEELTEIMQFVKDAARGRYSKAQCDQYIDILQQTLNKKNVCKCDNTGIVFSPENYVYKCRCAAGAQRTENFPMVVS